MTALDAAAGRSPAAPTHAAELDRTYKKVFWRIVPFLMLCYVVAYLDRVNVGFAKLQMSQDLAFSETVFAGAGIFFPAIFFRTAKQPADAPHRRTHLDRTDHDHVGPAVRIVRVRADADAVLRAALPARPRGSRLLSRRDPVLTYWFPSHRRAKIIAVFMSAIPVSGIFGNPLSGWIMERFHGGSGFHGWQWMFMIEAVPAVLVGIATILYLDNSIRSAKWLDEREKQLLEDEIAAQPQEQQKHGHSLKAVFADPRMWWMSLIYFAFVTGQYGHVLMPTLVKSTGITDTLQIGLLSAIPFLVAIVVMNLFGHADKRRERRWHRSCRR